jgi:hypothetical protein
MRLGAGASMHRLSLEQTPRVSWRAAVVRGLARDAREFVKDPGVPQAVRSSLRSLAQHARGAAGA